MKLIIKTEWNDSQDEEKRELIRAAFIAFQLGAGRKGMNFGQYLAKIGLSDKMPRHKGVSNESLARMGIKPKKVE